MRYYTMRWQHILAGLFFIRYERRNPKVSLRRFTVRSYLAEIWLCLLAHQTHFTFYSSIGRTCSRPFDDRIKEEGTLMRVRMCVCLTIINVEHI